MAEALAEAAAGAAGQICSCVLLYPLDTLKSRLQAELGRRGGAGGRGAGGALALRGLYAGLGAKAAHTLCAQFVFFYAYEWLRARARAALGGRAPGPLLGVAIGCLAGMANTCATLPLDTLASRKQTRAVAAPGEGRGAGRGAGAGPGGAGAGAGGEGREHGHGHGEEQEEEAPQGAKPSLYAGLSVSLLLSLNPGIQYAVFEELKGRLLRLGPPPLAAEGARGRGSPSTSSARALSAAEAFCVGALSKCAATLLTYPAIRAKVLCQSAGGERYGGALGAAGAVLRAEGAGGLYKGLSPQLIKTVLSAAVGLMLKEKIGEARRGALRALRRRHVSPAPRVAAPAAV